MINLKFKYGIHLILPITDEEAKQYRTKKPINNFTYLN